MQGGDIITRETFLDFELVFEWKVAKGANSGVKYNVDENLSTDSRPTRATLGFEYQVIDNIGFAEPLTPKQTAASLYDLVPAKPGNLVRACGRMEPVAHQIPGDGNQTLAERREGRRRGHFIGSLRGGPGREQVRQDRRVRPQEEGTYRAPGSQRCLLVPQHQDPRAGGEIGSR